MTLSGGARKLLQLMKSIINENGSTHKLIAKIAKQNKLHIWDSKIQQYLDELVEHDAIEIVPKTIYQSPNDVTRYRVKKATEDLVKEGIGILEKAIIDGKLDNRADWLEDQLNKSKVEIRQLNNELHAAVGKCQAAEDEVKKIGKLLNQQKIEYVTPKRFSMVSFTPEDVQVLGSDFEEVKNEMLALDPMEVLKSLVYSDYMVEITLADETDDHENFCESNEGYGCSCGGVQTNERTYMFKIINANPFNKVLAVKLMIIPRRIADQNQRKTDQSANN